MTRPTGTWPGYVAPVETPATPAEIAQQLIDAWPAVIGVEATFGELVAVLAQVMLETGTRETPSGSVPGYRSGNAGNLRGTFNGWWTSFRAGEGHGAGEVILEPGPNNRFRSYIGPGDPLDPASLRLARELGVRDMIALLFRKYPLALERAAVRDFSGYVHALHRSGYFTAEETAYAGAEERLRRTIDHMPQVAAFLEEPVMAMRRSA